MSTILKCKICGGSLAYNSNSKIVKCEYCGTKQILPLFSDESAQILYERGTNYLRYNEYDKAETIFNQLIALSPNDPEIYWNLVLCKYGVTFVKDASSGRYIPTCNRTHYQSVQQDANYKKAIEYSDDEKIAYYKENAEVIDKIQKGIISVSKKEKPYDIFISYKETDSSGNRTSDSIKAQNLYDKLTSLGYKVFFSRITLEDKVGTEYEPYIYAALYSSRIMLTVSSTKENIEAPWVKNEWSRYLNLRQQDSNKTLIPLYYGMKKTDLPDEFAILAAQDMDENGFEQELLRGIKKMIPLPIMIAERRKKAGKRASIIAAILTPVLLIAGVIIYPKIENTKKYEKAMALYNEEKYVEAAELFSNISGYKNADAMKLESEQMMIYEEAMQMFNNGDYSEAAELFSNMNGFKNADAMKLESEQMMVYEEAMQMFYNGDYCGAAWEFSAMNGYKDSNEMQKQAELNWRMQLATVIVDNARFDNIGEYYISSNGSINSCSDNSGNANNGLELDSHGKIISIETNELLYALCEDGYVKNSKLNNGLNEDWNDIIQITPKFNSTSVALTNKGEVIYGDISGKDTFNPKINDEWLREVDNWSEVVSLSYDIKEYDAAGVTRAALLGIKRDGSVYSTFYIGDSEEEKIQLFRDAEKFVGDLIDIKYINVIVSIEGVAIVAIDNNNKMFAFLNGETQITDDVCNARVVEEFDLSNNSRVFKIYVLDSKYRCKGLGTDNVLISDVVYLGEKYLITRTGNVYSDYAEKNLMKRNAQTCVYDVWMERN